MAKNIGLITRVVLLGFCFGMQPVLAAKKTIDIYRVKDSGLNQGIGAKMGTITFEDSKKGLVIRPQLTGLTAGEHGFHIHMNPTCASLKKDNKWVAAEAAGGHLDPKHTNEHLGPYAQGHLGDLPVLVIGKNGETESHETLLAPRLTVAKLEGHSVMIHQGGDNYTDNPPLGGGDGRIACGIIK